MLAALVVTGCDSSPGNENRTDGEVIVLEERQNAIQANNLDADQAGTTREAQAETNSPASRKLLDNAGADGNLITFSSLIRTANLRENLSGTGPYTLLAPTEAAFNALPDSVRESLTAPENRAQLEQLLNNHIIAGKLTTNDLQDGAILKTAAGHQLKVSKQNGQVRINSALVEDPDGMSSNGVLHTIDKVLMPLEQVL